MSIDTPRISSWNSSNISDMYSAIHQTNFKSSVIYNFILTTRNVETQVLQSKLAEVWQFEAKCSLNWRFLLSSSFCHLQQVSRLQHSTVYRHRVCARCRGTFCLPASSAANVADSVINWCLQWTVHSPTILSCHTYIHSWRRRHWRCLKGIAIGASCGNRGRES